EGLERGEITPRAQDEALATYAPRLRREDAKVDWSLTALAIAARWRAYTPWPALESTLRGDVIKLARIVPSQPAEGAAAPGALLGLDEAGVRVACGGGGSVAIRELQRPGGRRLPAG